MAALPLPEIQVMEVVVELGMVFLQIADRDYMLTQNDACFKGFMDKSTTSADILHTNISHVLGLQ